MRSGGRGADIWHDACDWHASRENRHHRMEIKNIQTHLDLLSAHSELLSLLAGSTDMDEFLARMV